MFIENNYAGTFLVKKIAQQKISVKFDPENTVEQTLEAITQRECDLIFTQSSYKHFEQQIHNASVLPDLVIQSKFLLNIIEFIHFMQQSNLLSQPLDQQSNSLVERLEEGFPVEFIYHSNTIEGSKISKENVAKIMQHQKLTYKVKKEIKEVENSIKARTFLQSDFIWNIANIKKLYHILTKDLLQETGIPYPRGFKKIPITVNNTATTDPQQVKKAVGELVQNVKIRKRTRFPLQAAFDFHLRYEQIHPFENGNGRTGRLLMEKILLQNELLPMIVFKDNKEAYFNAIKKATESKIGLKAYYTFMVEQYQKTLEKISINSL